MDEQNRTPLQEYIQNMGLENFYTRYGITKRSARAYLYGQRRPRFEVAQRIVADPESGITWDTVYARAASPEAAHG